MVYCTTHIEAAFCKISRKDAFGSIGVNHIHKFCRLGTKDQKEEVFMIQNLNISTKTFMHYAQIQISAAHPIILITKCNSTKSTT